MEVHGGQLVVSAEQVAAQGLMVLRQSDHSHARRRKDWRGLVEWDMQGCCVEELGKNINAKAREAEC